MAGAVLAQAQDKLDLVVGVSAEKMPSSVASMLTEASAANLAERTRKAGVEFRHFPEVRAAVVIFGDPFGLAARSRRALLAQRLTSAPLGSAVTWADMGDAEKLAVSEFINEHVTSLYGAKAESLATASFASGVGWAVSLQGGGTTAHTFVRGSAIDTPSIGEVRLRSLTQEEAEAAKQNQDSGLQGHDRPAPSVSFTVAPHVTAIARRARAMQRYLKEVEAAAQATYDRFLDAIENAALTQGDSAPAPGDRFDALPPDVQARLLENRRAHFQSYGFASATAASDWLANSRVVSSDAQLQIRVKVRLPDGTLTGFTATLTP
jgi:hypothetical protein